MKNYIVGLAIACCFSIAYGQKPPIQLDTYKSWTSVQNGHLSNDGKFAFYQINNSPIGKQTLVIKSTEKSFEYKIINDGDADFSDDSRFVIGKLSNDTLMIYNLYTRSLNKIPDVSAYNLFQINNKPVLASIQNDHKLIVGFVDSKSIYTSENVLEFKVSPGFDKLLLRKTLVAGNEKTEQIVLVDLTNNREQIIYVGENPSAFIFDDGGKQLAFMAKNDGRNEIFYFKAGLDKAILKVSEKGTDFSDLKIVDAPFWNFSKDGKKIFFTYTEKKAPNFNPNENLQISSYQDAYLKDYWYSNNIRPQTYLSIVDLEKGKITQLQKKNEEVVWDGFKHATDTLVLFSSSFGDAVEQWNDRARHSYSIYNLNTGRISSIDNNKRGRITHILMSPMGKYILYFDPMLKNYCCYEISTGKTRNITEGIADTWSRFDIEGYPGYESMVIDHIGWLKGDDGIIINSTYDIWNIDPLGRRSPVNITKGQGKKSKIIFSPYYEATDKMLFRNTASIITAFDLKTKLFGFYEVRLLSNPVMNKLSMNPVFTGNMDNGYNPPDKDDFSRAKNSKLRLIKLETANKAPNYFITKDLVKFTAISNVQPQKNYNWMTSELHNYTDSLGNKYQGILYKPENFDSTKKYPVLFEYYIGESNLLNSFQEAELAPSLFTISLMISNGYLVFLPDIHSKNKFSGDGAVLSLDAAATHLSGYSFINSKKMAIVGGSFGGFETNYIATHSTRYAAAVSCAAVSDMISFASGTWGNGIGQQTFAQNTALRMESTLTEDPHTYIRNSPILDAEKMNTPLLLMHNSKDQQSQYFQSKNFFIILRNLQKKVWWLNYVNEGHGLGSEENILDYNIKVWQFFDHYLKDQPMPDWMKEHI